MIKRLMVATVAIAAVATAGGAADEDNLINVPGAVWNVYGSLATQTPFKDKDVKGGHAVRITVSGKGANPYDAGAQTPITKAVHKGDHLWFVFYARSPSATADHPIHVPAIIQLAQAPYTADVQGTVDIGPDWQVEHVDGIATADHPAGSILGALQVAGDKQVIELGPAIISDVGPNG